CNIALESRTCRMWINTEHSIVVFNINPNVNCTTMIEYHSDRYVGGMVMLSVSVVDLLNRYQLFLNAKTENDFTQSWKNSIMIYQNFIPFKRVICK
ncbi:hypothetical protein BLOT_008087, partial [Blomia tropicalis]